MATRSVPGVALKTAPANDTVCAGFVCATHTLSNVSGQRGGGGVSFPQVSHVWQPSDDSEEEPPRTRRVRGSQNKGPGLISRETRIRPRSQNYSTGKYCRRAPARRGPCCSARCRARSRPRRRSSTTERPHTHTHAHSISPRKTPKTPRISRERRSRARPTPHFQDTPKNAQGRELSALLSKNHPSPPRVPAKKGPPPRDAAFARRTRRRPSTT